MLGAPRLSLEASRLRSDCSPMLNSPKFARCIRKRFAQVRIRGNVHGQLTCQRRDSKMIIITLSRVIVVGIILIASLGVVRNSHAQACGRTASTAQFDSFYGSNWNCSQSRVDDMWSRFDFDKGDWDNGMGWEDACNNALPLKRTFNALQVLAYSVTSWSSPIDCVNSLSAG